MRTMVLALSLFSMSIGFCDDQDVPGNPEVDFVTVDLSKEDPAKLTPTEKASLQEWVATREAEDEVAADLVKETPPANTITVKEIRENGRFIDAENGAAYKVPTPLRKKAMSWSAGDILRIEPTMRSKWVRLINVVSNESILAKIEQTGSSPDEADKGS